jgi:hypothetical protein
MLGIKDWFLDLVILDKFDSINQSAPLSMIPLSGAHFILTLPSLILKIIIISYSCFSDVAQI